MRLIKSKTRILFIFLFLFTYSGALWAQNEVEVSGTVMDGNGALLPGVSIFIENSPSTGTTSNNEGKFSLTKISEGSRLIFTFIGFDTLKKTINKSESKMLIILNEQQSDLDEVVVVGHGTQRKISVVGAITTIDPKLLNTPSSSVTNMLGGVVPGIIAVTRSGEPGNDFSEFWIRGISTFGANSGALVLIDGVEGNLNDIDPSDISGFSVLKDASATAVYGVRGANGVVIVTTHKGTAGKLSVQVKSNTSFAHSPRLPQYLDSYNYAKLANEARAVRGLDNRFSEIELSLMEYDMDPDLYPNVNWRDVILNDYTVNNQQYMNINGGGSKARYFLSVGSTKKSAAFKQDKDANKYETNVNWHKYNFRANVDASLTNSTTIGLGLDGVIVNQNAPGFGDNNNALWTAQANMTPVTVPVRYSNGLLPSFGRNGEEMSPYVLLNHTGYKTNHRATTKINFSLNQDLEMITPGLSLNELYSYQNNAIHDVYRRKMSDLYKAYGRYNDGSLMIQRTVSQQSASFSKTTVNDRKNYFESRVNFDRSFGEHRIGGLVHYYMEDFQTSLANDEIASIPKRYQAISGRATYSYRDTYFLESNLGYTGSENFKPGEQFGWFPSIAMGWVPTQYKFMQEKASFISFLKFRGSYGEVGNDQIGDRRFPYLTHVNFNGVGRWGAGGLTEGQVGADNLRWEVAKKLNVGIDVQFLSDKGGLTVDFFKDFRNGIFQLRQLMPDEVGVVNLPFVNVGKMSSQGFDGNIHYTHKFKKDLSLTLRSNFTYAHGKVEHWDQSITRYPYQSFSGVPFGVNRGLVALGLFTDSLEIMSSPKQTYGEVRPGDIRYKDINGDGLINDDDVVPLSFSNNPRFQYGFATSLTIKNFTVSALLEGISKANYFYGGAGYYPYAGGEIGNVLSIVNQDGNRWIPEWYSGDAGTENPNARFPRLTYGASQNNNRGSTFWLANGKYLRLKNVDVSYRLNANQLDLSKYGVNSIVLQLVGNNIAVWDKVKLWDPGQASGNGAVYPLQRTFTGQITVFF